MMLLVIAILCALSRLALCNNFVPSTLHKTNAKLESRIVQFEQRGIEHARRTLVIYHIGDLGLASNSLDIAINNLKIFLGAIEKHSKASWQKAFYLFNVVDDYNPLLSIIPLSRSNVAMLKWTSANSDLDTHLRTLQVLGSNVTDKFSTVIFTNQGVRGPLIKRENGEWLGEFQKLMSAHNVALVGPTLSCEVSPHVQTHMFAIRTSIIPLIMEDMKVKMTATYKSWQDLIASLEVGLTGVVMTAGYNVSSFLHRSRGQPYFSKCLTYTGPPNRFDQNPTGWCGVAAEDLIFVKWGGEPMRTPGMVCNSSLLHMEDILETMAANEPHLQLIIPEVMMGGPMYPLFKEYANEAWIDRHPPLVGTAPSANKVCFLVRVLRPTPQLAEYDNPNTWLINKELKLLITTLRRQSNPNWVALFYRVDSQPSEDALTALLRRFSDSRLEEVKLSGNATYTTADAGYARTDEVLRQALRRSECHYITITTSDNAYGSEVVDRILRHSAPGTGLLINPTDSRRYLEQDMLFQKRFLAVKQNSLEDYCQMLPNLQYTTLTYGMRPVPLVGSMDLSSAFLLRTKLLRERVFFGNFSDAVKYPCVHNLTDPVGYKCLNNQGAYLVHHLVQRRLWSYARLPIDGLRSVVFHGNSPTLCIGAGNVWVDHYDPAQQRCITPKDALTIEFHPYWGQIYNLGHFFTQGQILGTCLRVRQTPEAVAAATVALQGQPLNAQFNKAVAWYLVWLQSATALVGAFL